ncbi:MAG TPA: DNA-3-methyladenine glycosylase 2 family protein [Planctomycetota bacterium]|nr:DNA-3-methyladenine glycosylase 2 family protein [Planctomycetota bacterium]
MDRDFQRKLASAIEHLSRVSPELREWISTFGPCTLKIAEEQELYVALVRAIAHQQLHGRAAETILGRLRAAYGGEMPPPRKLARARIDKLRAMGFSNAKALAIIGVAKAALNGTIPTLAEAAALSNEELIERLTELRGIGQWTVEMLLIFTLGRMDVMPVDDFGVQTGLKLLLKLKSHPKKKADFDKHTAAWSPYRSVAAWYLWRKVEAVRAAALQAKPRQPSKSAIRN